MPEKQPYHVRRHVGHRDPVDLFLHLLSHERKQQTKRVSIAALRVSSQVAFAD